MLQSFEMQAIACCTTFCRFQEDGADPSRRSKQRRLLNLPMRTRIEPCTLLDLADSSFYTSLCSLHCSSPYIYGRHLPVQSRSGCSVYRRRIQLLRTLRRSWHLASKDLTFNPLDINDPRPPFEHAWRLPGQYLVIAGALYVFSKILSVS